MKKDVNKSLKYEDVIYFRRVKKDIMFMIIEFEFMHGLQETLAQVRIGLGRGYWKKIDQGLF